MYDIIKEEFIPGSLEDFRALMHEIYESQPQFREDSIFLQGERTPSDYPETKGRWEVTLGGTLQQRGFILARQFSNGTMNLRFAYHSKFQRIGSQFDIEFVDRIMEQAVPMNLRTSWELPHAGMSEKQSNTHKFNLKNIRALLIEGFADDELRRLCYDEPNFRPVYEQLSQGMGKDQVIDKLIEYADRRELIEKLLALAKERNPRKYEKHQPYDNLMNLY